MPPKLRIRDNAPRDCVRLALGLAARYDCVAVSLRAPMLLVAGLLSLPSSCMWPDDLGLLSLPGPATMSSSL